MQKCQSCLENFNLITSLNLTKIRKDQMNLDEFIKDMLDRVEAFKLYWDTLNKRNSVSYPSKMYSGDWDEQFCVFCELADRPEDEQFCVFCDGEPNLSEL